MNNLILVLFITCIGLSSVLISPPVSGANAAATICEYVASDDKKRLRSFLKANKLKIRRIFSQVQCNGQNLLAFAVSSGAIQTGTLMISKLPKKVVSANLTVLQSGAQPLIDAANARLGG